VSSAFESESVRAAESPEESDGRGRETARASFFPKKTDKDLRAKRSDGNVDSSGTLEKHSE
jgi:hypothetical protein